MNKKFLGFAVFLLVLLAACHNIFNKDKVRTKKQVRSVEKKTVVPDPGSQSAFTATAIPPDVAKDSTLRYVYLTFDDGPDAGTLNCYDICKSKSVKATFFLIGEHAQYKQGKAILDTMRADLRHVFLANHSYSHAGHNNYQSFYSNPINAMKDFVRTQDSLDFKAPIVRFPGNNAWAVNNKIRSPRLTRPLSKLMDSLGFDVMGWDVEWRFDRKSRPIQSAELMASEVIHALDKKTSFQKNHVVLLAHDRMFRDQNYRDSLAKMITILQSRKIIFETADQYPMLRDKNRKMLLAVNK